MLDESYFKDDKNKTGYLLNPNNIKLNRFYFKQMCDSLGITVLYRRLLPGGKRYNAYGELDSYFYPSQIVRCIYDEHPNMKQMRKLGWNAELADGSILVHVPYDLEGLEAGCLFILPSGVDSSEGRVFRVLRMQSIAIYPASITCELGPVLVNESEEAVVEDFKNSNFNLLCGEEEKYGY